MSNASPDGPFDILLGTVIVVSFVAFAFCVASLRRHVDEEKASREGIGACQIPPERVLTATGLRRVRIAKITLGIFLTCTAIVVVQKQILGS
jgi:Na+/melibiose symporter-like transporter